MEALESNIGFKQPRFTKVTSCEYKYKIGRGKESFNSTNAAIQSGTLTTQTI